MPAPVVGGLLGALGGVLQGGLTLKAVLGGFVLGAAGVFASQATSAHTPETDIRGSGRNQNPTGTPDGVWVFGHTKVKGFPIWWNVNRGRALNVLYAISNGDLEELTAVNIAGEVSEVGTDLLRDQRSTRSINPTNSYRSESATPVYYHRDRNPRRYAIRQDNRWTRTTWMGGFLYGHRTTDLNSQASGRVRDIVPNYDGQAGNDFFVPSVVVRPMFRSTGANRQFDTNVIRSTAYLSGRDQGPIWTSNHLAEGISLIWVTLAQGKRNGNEGRGPEGDHPVWKNANPALEFIVKGMKFQVPGTNGLLLPASYSANAADVAWWWLRHRRGIPAEDIDLDAFLASQALCNETLTLTDVPDNVRSTRNRGEFNGSIASTDPPVGIEKQLALCMNGSIVEWGGKYFIRAGEDSVAKATILPRDIVERGPVFPDGDALQRITEATVVLEQSRSANFNSQSIHVVDETAETAFGERLQGSPISLKFVNDPVVAHNIARDLLRHVREPMTLTITCDPRSDLSLIDNVMPGDKLDVHDPDVWGFGSTDSDGTQRGKSFEVMSSTVNNDWTVSFQLREWPADRFTDTLVPYEDREIIRIGNVSAPNPENVRVTALYRSSRIYASYWSLGIEWDAKPEYGTSITVRHPTDAQGNTEVTNVTGTIYPQEGIAFLQVWLTGEYTVEVRHTAAGNENIEPSEIVTVTHTIPLPTSPQPPLWFRSRTLGPVFQSELGTDDDSISAVQVRAKRAAVADPRPTEITETEWATSQEVIQLVSPSVQRRQQTSDIQIHIPIGSDGNYRFAGKFVDTFGQESEVFDMGGAVISGLREATSAFRDYGPTFPGTHNNTFVWTLDTAHAGILIHSPGTATGTTISDWNGGDGWPFGVSNRNTAIWTADPLDMDTVQGSVNVLAEFDLVRQTGSTQDDGPIIELSPDGTTWTTYANVALTFTSTQFIHARVIFRRPGSSGLNHGGLINFSLNAVVV